MGFYNSGTIYFKLMVLYANIYGAWYGSGFSAMLWKLQWVTIEL